MKITRLRTQVVHLPIDPPILTAILGSIHTAACVLTFLDTDEGLTGEGLVFSINNRRLSVILEMIRQLEDMVVGMDPRIGGALNAGAWKELNFLGYEGVSIVALAAVDNALWDLRGKAAGLNVAHLIGACRTCRAHLCQWRAVAGFLH
jgi:L-alanine-DL-glutamate epimerase-like enolase superfamily enzyme